MLLYRRRPFRGDGMTRTLSALPVRRGDRHVARRDRVRNESARRARRAEQAACACLRRQLSGDLQPSRYGRRAAFPSAFLLFLPLSRPLQDHAFPIAPNNFFLSFRFRFVIIETISGECKSNAVVAEKMTYLHCVIRKKMPGNAPELHTGRPYGRGFGDFAIVDEKAPDGKRRGVNNSGERRMRIFQNHQYFTRRDLQCRRWFVWEHYSCQ